MQYGALRAAAPPLMAAAVLAVVGTLGVWADVAWLFPSLGPTLALQSASPRLASAQPRHVVAGHMIGLAVGFAAVWLTGAAAVPSPIESASLTVPRVLAAAVALPLSMSLQLAANARHPPAEATTLLVALGAFEPRLQSAITVISGVALVAIGGELVRRIAVELGR